MTLLFLGDVSITPNAALPALENETLRNALFSAQHVICNLEGPIASRPAPIQKVGPDLSQDAQTPNWLRSIGVTHSSLANNHIFDHGVEALHNTVYVARQNGLVTFGHSATHQVDGWTLSRISVNDKDVTLIGAAEQEFNIDLSSGAGSCIADPINLYTIIIEEWSQNRIPIIVLHGGVEYEHLPPPSLRRLARWLIEIGAGAVITHHPHVPGCIEHWQGAPIAYSLGDFWMSRARHSTSSWRRYGYAVQLTVNQNGQVILDDQIPYVADFQKGSIRSLSCEELSSFSLMQQESHELLCNDNAYCNWWMETAGSRAEAYLRNYSGSPLNKYLWAFFWRHVLRLTSQKLALRHWQGLQCLSHRDLWRSALLHYLNARHK